MDSFRFLHSLSHQFPCLCRYGTRYSCGIPKTGTRGKLKRTAHFLRLFSSFPQEFSTHAKFRCRVRAENTSGELSKSALRTFLHFFPYFFPLFFHTKNHSRWLKQAPQIHTFVPFHSFRRHYYLYYLLFISFFRYISRSEQREREGTKKGNLL